MWEQSSQFWAVRDAWRTATRAASQGRRAQFSLAKQETRWAVNADRYLRNSPSAAAFVKFNQEQIRASLRHHLESIGPELAAQFDEVLAPIAAIAFGGLVAGIVSGLVLVGGSTARPRAAMFDESRGAWRCQRWGPRVRPNRAVAQAA